MTTFKKKRNGRVCEFDKQIQLWRRHRKKHGVLANSINKRAGKEKLALEQKKALQDAANHLLSEHTPTTDLEKSFTDYAKAMFGSEDS